MSGVNGHTRVSKLGLSSIPAAHQRLLTTDVLVGFVDAGKCVRSTFAYVRLLCGADDDHGALRAAASFELLHTFALLQDDVMDGPAERLSEAAGFPTWDQVLDVLWRKSGNYTVRRPLEIGAAMSGCVPGVLAPLSRYGETVGEAFQLRDDVPGIFGAVEVTGKPPGSALSEHKATIVAMVA